MKNELRKLSVQADGNQIQIGQLLKRVATLELQVASPLVIEVPEYDEDRVIDRYRAALEKLAKHPDPYVVGLAGRALECS